MRVMLIEDSVRLQESVGRGLRLSGYAVDVVGNGIEGLWSAASNDYDVIILDIMLPGLDGLSLLQQLRAKGKTTHVLLLTAKDSVEDRVQGLKMGADDYLIKPFAFEELLARVQALCRRSYQRKNPCLAVGDLRIDTASRTVSRNGLPLDLTQRELMLLEYLALRSGEVVSRSEIETHLYPDHVDIMSNVVDSAVCILRKKISAPGKPPLILTRRGHGYLLQEDPA